LAFQNRVPIILGDFYSMQAKQLRSVAMAFGLMFFGAFSSAWGAAPAANGSQELSATRMVAMGIGAIGGIVAYSAITGDWGLGIWGVEAAGASIAAAPAAATAATTAGAAPATAAVATAAAAVPTTAAQVMAAAPNAAARFVAAWGGRRVFIPLSAALGALVGDWIQASN
jgi:hypothetical protein